KNPDIPALKDRAIDKKNLFTRSLQLRKMLVEQRNGLYSFQVIPYSEMLIGRMDRVAVQSEAHQDGLAFQGFLKEGNYRDASTAALRDRRLSEGFFVGIICGLVFYGVDGRNVSLASVMRFHQHFYTLWRKAFEVFFEKFRDLLPVLVRNQPHRDLCKCFAWDH